MPIQQLPLDLQVRSTEEHGDFIISDCNSIAAQWVDRWPKWVGQFCALNIAGPEASGKSHLAAAWQEKTGAVLIGNIEEKLANLGDRLHFVLDLDKDSPSETELFHLFNHTRETGGSVLIISTEPVARLAWQLPDLASRMRAVNLAMIEEPDDKLLYALLHKNFVERQLYAPENVIQYLVARMERSFAAARNVVVKMDRLSLAKRSQITLSLARSVMGPGQDDFFEDKPPK